MKPQAPFIHPLHEYAQIFANNCTIYFSIAYIDSSRKLLKLFKNSISSRPLLELLRNSISSRKLQKLLKHIRLCELPGDLLSALAISSQNKKRNSRFQHLTHKPAQLHQHSDKTYHIPHSARMVNSEQKATNLEIQLYPDNQ